MEPVIMQLVQLAAMPLRSMAGQASLNVISDMGANECSYGF
jgi:hypothetical protein